VVEEGWKAEVAKAVRLLAVAEEAQWFWKTKEGISGGRVASLAALQRLVLAAEHSAADLYLNVNETRRCGIKAARRDVVTWRYVVVDLDPADSRQAPVGLPNLELLGRVLNVPAVSQYLTVLDSGRGYQVWVAVTPHLVRDDAPRIERSMSGFLHTLAPEWPSSTGLKVDTSCSDLARVVRCPGSINWKTGRRARVLQTPTAYLPHEHIFGFYRPVQPVAPLSVSVAEESANLRMLRPHLTHTARQFLLHGVSEPGRHAAAFAAAACLRDLGIEVETAAEWVAVGAVKCRGPLHPRDALRAVENAYRIEAG